MSDDINQIKECILSQSNKTTKKFRENEKKTVSKLTDNGGKDENAGQKIGHNKQIFDIVFGCWRFTDRCQGQR